MFQRLFDLPSRGKFLLLVVSDLLLLPIALWMSFSFRLGQLYVPSGREWWLIVAAPLVAIPIFVHLGLYRAVVRFMGNKVLWIIIEGTTLSVMLWGVVAFLFRVHGTPRSVIFIYWFTSIAVIWGSRLLAQWLFSNAPHVVGCKQRVVIFGAGGAGRELAAGLRHGMDLGPVAFVDDNPVLTGREIDGLKVYQRSDLEKLIDAQRIDEVLIAIPSASRSVRQRVIDWLEPYPVHVRVLPSLSELAQGKVRVEDLKEVEIEDLLGRDPVPPDEALLATCIRGKSVLVTGAGGSIGSELCRQIIILMPKRLVLLERNESALYQIEKELRTEIKASATSANMPFEGDKKEPEIIVLVGSVLHQNRVEMACKVFSVQTIYHAAAYKHVPMVELNPIEAVYNNIFGTYRVARAAIACSVENFVLISTDKAVRSTNVMGATKRFGELILQGLNAKYSLQSVASGVHRIPIPQTKFCMVRFGNVLNSSGSVIPLFREQIKNEGPITVTHKEIIRYFMTIPEAAQLVLQAGAMAKGGDVFVLDMGDPVRILNLAERMIRLAGLQVKDEQNPEGDIEIQFTGLRPGEKLYEELLIGDDVSLTDHPKIMRASEEMLPWNELMALLEEFEEACDNVDFKRVLELLQAGVKDYTPQGDCRDVVWKRTTSNR
ncbi:MAG: polysaccharide biosynthesis protein [Gammaproteobacteria bacterium]|nr:polysaccharide biosynthesis protein [Gammaproteobacteria bacterium]